MVGAARVLHYTILYYLMYYNIHIREVTLVDGPLPKSGGTGAARSRAGHRVIGDEVISLKNYVIRPLSLPAPHSEDLAIV